MTVEALARTGDPGTSHQSARELDPNVLTRQQAAVLELLRESGEGLTDEELTALYFKVRAMRGWPMTKPDSVRKRRSQLVRKGLVGPASVVRNTGTHRDVHVWSAVAA